MTMESHVVSVTCLFAYKCAMINDLPYKWKMQRLKECTWKLCILQTTVHPSS